MDEVITVIIADDHHLVREGLRAMLENKNNISIVGEAADGVEAVALALRLRPDVILMDLEMPRKNGINAIQEIIAKWPAARILVLSSFSDDVQVLEAIRAGAGGYLLKTSKLNELVDAIREVYSGETPLDPIAARRLLNSINKERTHPNLIEVLTRRELTILPLVVRGKSNKEIAEQLNISLPTVGSHVGNMINKAEVNNRVQLTTLALKQGLTSLFSEE